LNPADVLISPLSFTERLPVRTTGALVEKFLAVPWSGSSISSNIDDNDFYLILVSPNKARLIIRDVIHVTAAKAKGNLRRYVESLAMEEDDRMITIEDIIKALQARDGSIAKKLVRTAYLGEILPPGVLQRAVSRIQRSALWRYSSLERPAGVKANDYEKGRKDWIVLCALLKLYFVLGKGSAVPVEKQKKKVGHLLGELFALLEEAQRRSSGKTASTLTTRYFSSAMTTPTAVIPSIVATAVKAYLPKIKRDRSGYSELEMELERIMEEVDNSGGMPSILPLEEQADFVLGFYSKKAKLERQKKERMEKKQQEEVRKYE
jgi:CRISPR-associated protein Csd1